MIRGLASEMEEPRDLPGVVDPQQSGSLRIGIIERKELRWRGRTVQIHRASEKEPMRGEIGEVLPHDLAKHVNPCPNRGIGHRKIVVSKTVTCPTSRLVAYVRRPPGVAATPFAVLGSGAVAITELLAALTSVIPPPPLLTYTIAGCARSSGVVDCAAPGVGLPNQVTSVIRPVRASQLDNLLRGYPADFGESPF